MNAKWFAVAAIGLMGLSRAATGQRSIHLAVGGGTSMPLGRFSDAYKTDGSAFAGIVWGSQWSFLGARLGYSANTFAGKTIGDTVYKRKTAPAVTAGLVVSLPLGVLKPYIVGGPGLYPFRTATDTKTKTRTGVNGGAGITFPFLFGSGFLEGQYHSVLGMSRPNLAGRFATATLGLVL